MAPFRFARSAVAVSLVASLVLALITAPMLAAAPASDALVARVTTLAAEQLIGITPILANTPFLGFATLCGLAVMADTTWARESNTPLAQSIRQNRLITRMRPYSSGWLFAFLLLLALLAYATNSGKIQGIVGKLVHVVEAVTVLVAYVVLSTTVLRDLPTPPSPAMAQMGVVSVTTGVLLGVSACVALSAMMLVRLAIGLAIWLIPVPLVDLAFETVKKIVTGLMILVYLINPLLATFIAFGLIVMSLFIAGWAWRLLAFVARIIVLPRLGFHGTPPAAGRLVLRASALAVRGFRRRESAALAVGGEQIHLLRRATDRTAIMAFPASEARLLLVRGFWWSELRDVDANGSVVNRIAFATPAFETFRRATMHLAAAVDQSKLSMWLGPREISRTDGSHI